MSKKYTFEFIKNNFKKYGYELLENSYTNAHQKLRYKCPKGHKHNITWNHWQQGHRCPYCDGQSKPTIEFIKAEFKKEGYTLLTKKYINSQQKLEYICPKGHKHSIRWSNWKNGKARCIYCSAKERAIKYHRMSFDYIRKSFQEENYILLTNEYENCEQKLESICPNGHKYFVSWHIWEAGYRCPKCNNNGISKWEIEVKKFLDDSNISYIPNDRTQLINPNTKTALELDIWIPELAKAIECNGKYWHSFEKRKSIDTIKRDLCKNLDIDLLIITDEEWNSNIDGCKYRILKFLENLS